jgi:hypothetical protein
VKQLGQNADNPIAFVIAVAIVELLGVVEIGVTNREVIA